MLRVLLVEDDEQLGENLMTFLESEHYETVHALGQTDALAAFSRGKYDCVLLDLSLRDGDGFAVCSAIRAQSQVPVIFLTASADEACTVAGFELGADDYISKPFRPRELIARMKNAIRRTGVQSQLLQCGDVVLDQSRGTVSRAGEEIFLSALEYRLLLVLFTNKETLMTREQLIDEMWAASSEFVSGNTLNVYIKRLREKIEDDPQEPRILKTVRGVGYKAVEP